MVILRRVTVEFTALDGGEMGIFAFFFFFLFALRGTSVEGDDKKMRLS